MNGALSDNANEAAHEAVLELIKANSLSGHSIAGRDAGKYIAKNLIDLHRELAAYYRSLDQEV